MGNVAWALPAKTLVSTSHTANQSLTGFLEATLNVVPYEITPGTILCLSLYVNSQLVANETYSLSGRYQSPATIVATSGLGVANFSDSMLGFTVSEFPLVKVLPSGTVVTVVVWASNGIWVQVDKSSMVQSYETQGVTSYYPAPGIAYNSGTIAPKTLSVVMESSAT